MKIDFLDISDIEGSASLILSMSGTAPSLVPEFKIQNSKFQNSSAPIPGFNIQNSTFKIITKVAREWVNGGKEHIGEMSAGDAMRAAGCLDLMHRLAYGTPADSTLLDTYRLAAFDSFVRGDGSVDRYHLFNMVSSEVRQRNRKFFGKPLQWESMCVDRWHRQFQHGASLEELPDLDTVRRVTALLSSDLWAFETKNESRYKQTLFENHRHLLDNYQLSIINYQFLSALQSFLLSSAPYLSPEEFTTYDTQIRNALIASKETNRYHREALRLSSL